MSRFSKYLKATAAEMKHVKWPSRRQAIVYSLLVIAVSTFTALFTAGFDFIFTSLLNIAV